MGPTPLIEVNLNSGDSVILPASVKLLYDGLPVAATISPNGGVFNISYQVPGVLDPESVHDVGVVFQEGASLKTNSFRFTVVKYQNVTLPAPFILETFDSVEEGGLPTGWVATNRTDVDVEGLDISNAHSDSYKDFVVITADTLLSVHGQRRLNQNPIVLNGSFIDPLASGSLLYAESDVRRGNQVQVLFSSDYNLTGKSNVFVAFHSLYEQNQDNINAVEYSVDGGANWLPIIYMIAEAADDAPVDVIRRADGTVDAVATLNRAQGNSAYGLPYGAFIGAPITSALDPFISGRVNDDQRESKRIEVVRIPQADNKATVRFRFVQAGTASWYWGIDNFGLYIINTPVITTQPAASTVSYGETATLKVVATGAGTLTYQWLFKGVAIPGATSDTLVLPAVTGASAGEYKVVVRNADGPTTSAGAILNVIIAPEVTTQPQPVLASAGATATFSVAARGQQPFTYQWQKGTADIAGATAASYSIAGVTAANAGDYRVKITGPGGSIISAAVALKVIDESITSGLVAHYKFDGNANDASGRGNDAVPQGQPETGGTGPTFPATGARIGANSMHIADGQHLYLGQAADFLFGSDVNFTFAFWVKGPATGAWTGDPSFIGNKAWTSGGNPGYVVAAQGGGAYKWNWKGEAGPRRDTASLGGLTDGNWHHVVVSHDRTGLAYFYVDGSLKVTVPIAGDGNADALDLYIGQDGTGRYGFDNDLGAHFLDINVDDFGIWRRLLSPQEVASIYGHGLQGEDLTTASGAPVILPPNVTAGPASQTVSAGASVTLSATVEGTAPFTYQWQKDTVDIAGATSATLALNNVGAAAAGSYRVVVTNSKGTSTSPAGRIAVSSAALNGDLVLNLKFNGNYDDASGRGNAAAAVGAPTFSAGKLGQAVRVVTAGAQKDYATLGTKTDLQFGDATDFSVGYWVNITSSESDPSFISNKDWDSSSNPGWGIFAQGGGNFRINFTGTPGGSGNRLSTTSTPNIRDGNWHHVLVSFWRGVAASTYVDGVLVNITPLTTTGSVDTALALNIGQDGTGNYGSPLNALIDDVAIWRRVVTAQEAAAIVAGGNAGNDLGTLAGGGAGDVRITSAKRNGANVEIAVSGTGTLSLERKSSLSDATWTPVTATAVGGVFTVPADGATGFFRAKAL